MKLFTRIARSFDLKRFLLLAITIDAVLFLAGCTTSWVTEASSIVTLLGPAIASALEILAAFGVGLSPAIAASITAWGKQAQTALQQVATLINQYNAAAATAKPGILSEIQTLLSTISGDLATLLPTLHVTDPATQAKIIAVFNAVAGELAALVILIPSLKSASALEDHTAALLQIAKAAHAAHVKSAQQFASDFNKKAGALGPQYKIKAA